MRLPSPSPAHSQQDQSPCLTSAHPPPWVRSVLSLVPLLASLDSGGGSGAPLLLTWPIPCWWECGVGALRGGDPPVPPGLAHVPHSPSAAPVRNLSEGKDQADDSSANSVVLKHNPNSVCGPKWRPTFPSFSQRCAQVSLAWVSLCQKVVFARLPATNTWVLCHTQRSWLAVVLWVTEKENLESLK